MYREQKKKRKTQFIDIRENRSHEIIHKLFNICLSNFVYTTKKQTLDCVLYNNQVLHRHCYIMKKKVREGEERRTFPFQTPTVLIS